LGALALVVVLGLIAIAHFQRARVAAKEAQAIGDTRAVILAEQTYASANCGLFNDLTRLCRDGPECEGIGIPGYEGPDFISGELGRKSPYAKSGYERLWTGLGPIILYCVNRFARLSLFRSVGPIPYSRSGTNCVGTTVALDEPAWGCAVAPLSVANYCYTSTPIDLSGARSFGGDATGALHADPTGEPIPCFPLPQPFCIVEGTLVATPLGSIPIEQIHEGDEVWGVDEDRKMARNTVARKRSNRVHGYLRLVLENGETLELTAMHPVSTPTGWQMAGELRAGGAVHYRDGLATVDRIETIDDWAVVYDITVQPDANFLANGVLVHNKLF